MISCKTYCAHFLATLAFTAFSFSVVAQKYSIGVKGGASMAWPSFGDKEAKDEFGRKLKPGFHGGLVILFPLKNKYQLILEGGLSKTGRILRFDNNTWDNNLTMEMADMTMLLRKSFPIRIKKDVPTEAFVNLGPHINYWFGGSGKFENGDNIVKYGLKFGESPDGDNDYRNMYLNNINQWLFGLGVGVGVNAPLRKNQHLTFEVRFVSGHTFLGKKESTSIDILAFDRKDTFKTNLKTISLNLCYYYDFDRVERRKGKSTIKKRMKVK